MKKCNSDSRNEYLTFNTSKRGGMVLLKISDIVYITTDKDEPRNKFATMRNGTKHILMDYTTDELSALVPHLMRPNNKTLVSQDIIISKSYYFLIIEILDENGKKITVNITRTFRSQFKKQLSKG
jgi:hypothetical protein